VQTATVYINQNTGRGVFKSITGRGNRLIHQAHPGKAEDGGAKSRYSISAEQDTMVLTVFVNLLESIMLQRKC
jgi:DNA-binding MarR family transcriptional regulator